MIEFKTTDERRAFAPGDEIAGQVAWVLDQPPKTVELRLIWHTTGKGDRDVETVDSVTFDAPSAHEMREFAFTLPDRPYSFSGKLITLKWGLELIAFGAGETEVFDFVMSPTGEEIALV